MFRMIAFSHRLPSTGQKQLKDVLGKRFRKIAKKLREFQLLSFKDREEVGLEKTNPNLISYFRYSLRIFLLLWKCRSVHFSIQT